MLLLVIGGKLIIMSSIYKLTTKINFFLKKLTLSEDIFTVLIIILVGFVSFGLGRFSLIYENKEPVRIIHPKPLYVPTNAQNSPNTLVSAIGEAITEKMYVASKNGKKYHLPWCSGALRMKEENKIWFASKEEAESRGYTKALNCKGI